MSLDETKREDTAPSDDREAVQPQEEDLSRFSIFDEPMRPDDKPQKNHKLNSRTRALLIALTAAVCTAILLLVVTLLPQGTIDPTSSGDILTSETVTYTLYDHTADDTQEAIVQSIKVDNANGIFSIVFNKKENAYQLTGYEDLHLSINADELAEYCAKLEAYNKIDAAGNLADFGLDKPVSEIVITYHDGSVTTLHVGDMTPTEEGYYICLDGSNEVYAAEVDTINYFLAADWWYVSTTLFEAPVRQEGDETGTALLKELHVTGSAYDEDLALRRPVADDGDEYSYFKYVTTKPYLRGVNDSVGDDLYGFTSLNTTRAAILHPTAAQKTKYGFDDPLIIATVTLAIENETQDSDGNTKQTYYNHCTYTVKVGSVDKDNNYVVMMDGINAIFLASPEDIATIVERTHVNTTTSVLFLKDITTVSKINLTNNGETTLFELTHYPNREEDDDKLAVYVDDEKLDTANFRKLYVLMMGLERYGILEEEPIGTPETTLTLYRDSGEPYLSINCYTASGSLTSVKTSDGEIFTIKTSTLTNLLKETENLLNGEDVQS